MATQSDVNSATIQAILAREEQRCQAISNQRSVGYNSNKCNDFIYNSFNCSSYRSYLGHCFRYCFLHCYE